MLKLTFKTMALTALLGLSFVTSATMATAQAELRIVASFSILGDMVQQVAGDKSEVTTIVGPDADAHLYMPNAGDAIAVTDADIIFVNGMGFETWSSSLIETSKTKAVVVTATEGVVPVMVEGEVDPHAWNALENGVIYVQNIAKALSDLDAKNASYYQGRADAYIAELRSLDKKAAARFGALPEGSRYVVTAHDAFGYLADAYGLTFLAPVGIDTEAEPTARELADLIDFLKEVNAKALFVENITNPDLINQISVETGIKVEGRLYSDALSVKGSPATSYLAMYEHNLESLMTALSK